MDLSFNKILTAYGPPRCLIRHWMKEKQKKENQKKWKFELKLCTEVSIKTQPQCKTMSYPPFASFKRSFLVDMAQMSIISQVMKMCPWKISAVYLDSYGVNIAIRSGYREKYGYSTEYIAIYAPCLIHMIHAPNKPHWIVPRLKETYEPTACSFQTRASVDNGACLVTGKIAGYKELEFYFTAGHLVTSVGDIVDIGGGIKAECIAKEDVIEFASGLRCTADMAFLKVIGQENHDNFNKIEIDGNIYSKRLLRGGTAHLTPGKEVRMYNQFEEIKKGIIVRYMEWNVGAKLYKVFQIGPKAEVGEVTEEQAQEQKQNFSAKGDSGACVFLPPDAGSSVVDVFGMVVSRCPTTGLTNVVILENVMPYILKKTIDSLYPKGPDIRDDDDETVFNAIEFVEPVAVPGNLPAGQDLSGQTTLEGYACANIGAVQDRESGFGSASGYSP